MCKHQFFFYYQFVYTIEKKTSLSFHWYLKAHSFCMLIYIHRKKKCAYSLIYPVRYTEINIIIFFHDVCLEIVNASKTGEVIILSSSI